MDKKILISALHRVANMSFGDEKASATGTNDLLVLITAAGQITGTPLTPLQAANESNLKEYLLDHVLSTLSDVAAEHEDDSFILLKNATLKTPRCDITYSYLYVFTDDIIAATVTNSDPN